MSDFRAMPRPIRSGTVEVTDNRRIHMNAPARRLTRPRSGKVIAGVCASIGNYFGISSNVVRILFVLSCLLPGQQFVLYLLLWIIVPKAAY